MPMPAIEIYYICFLLIFYNFNKTLQFLMDSKDFVNFTAVGDIVSTNRRSHPIFWGT
jgi:hypothetical protein